MAAQGSGSAGDLLLSGESVLPMGGFGGRAPFPTADGLAAMISSGQLRFVLLGPMPPGAGQGPQAWVTAHCRAVDAVSYGGAQQVRETLYDCAG